MAPRTPSPAQVARDRLLADRVARPVAEQRAALAVLAARFEKAGWVSLVTLLGSRVRTEPQLMPMMKALLRRQPTG